jgi:hypothetical protein
MKSVVNSLFQFNLRYQDTIIKIELEKTEKTTRDLHRDTEHNEALKRVLRIVSAVLHTTFFRQGPLYLELTNMELDIIVLKCLWLLIGDSQTFQQPETLIELGCTANEIARLVQNRILSRRTTRLQDIVPFVLYSGVVWWSDAEVQQRYQDNPNDTVLKLYRELTELAKGHLAINDLPLFQLEVAEAKTHKRLLYFLDDNGELVWDLLLIQFLLEANPNLSITCVVNEIPVTNNVNVASLLHCLEKQTDHPNVLESERFEYLGESNELPAVDLRFISPQLRKHLEEADIILVKGVSFFEKLQYLPAPTYYMFTVYSATSRILTGLQRYSGVFARIGPHLCAFSHIIEANTANAIPKMNLAAIHSVLQTPAYKEFVQRFASEAEANLVLRSKFHQLGIALETSAGQLKPCDMGPA